MMLRVALTGGIATGKSYVLEQFRRRGVPCLDADLLAHGVMAPGTEAARAIAKRFGAGVIAEDGSVNRGLLGPIVFADERARRDLEAIVHPAVYRAIAAGLRGFELVGGHRLAVVDVPLLYETGHGADFDRVIVTVCAPEVQMARLAARGMGPDEARLRMAAQLTSQERVAGADFVIRTDESPQATDAQVDRILEHLMASGS
jgi:dephospho-CoA kinase